MLSLIQHGLFAGFKQATNGGFGTLGTPAQPASNKAKATSTNPFSASLQGTALAPVPSAVGGVSVPTLPRANPSAVSGGNPFAINGPLVPNGTAVFGVNQPLAKPLFLGYHNNQPLYAGEKLYVLC
jgi:hypothetical protein